MNRYWRNSVVATMVLAFCGLQLVCSTGGAQQNGGTGTGTGMGSGSGSGIGTNNTAGAGSNLSSAQGYGLDSRYTGGGFNRFMTGSTTMGSTTAGARAGQSGAFGQSSQSGGMGGMSGMGGMGGTNRFGGMSGMMGMGMGRNMMMSGNMSGMQQSGQTTGRVRTRLRLGFTNPASARGSVSTRFTSVVNRVLEREDVGGGQVTVTLEGDTAVLRGIVPSDHTRSVLENLAMLEPGIGAVRNELTVDPDVPTPSIERTRSSSGQRQ